MGDAAQSQTLSGADFQPIRPSTSDTVISVYVLRSSRSLRINDLRVAPIRTLFGRRALDLDTVSGLSIDLTLTPPQQSP